MILSLNNLSEKWLSFLLNSSFQMTLFFLLIILFSLFLRKRSARFLYGLWFLFLIKAVLPPSIHLPFTSQSEILPHISLISFSSDSFISPVKAAPAPVPTFGSWLMTVWLLSFLFLSLLTIFKNIRFFNHLRGAQPFDKTALKALLKNEKHLLKISVFSIAGIKTPFTVGLLRPKIYLPPESLSWEHARLEAVLLHEIAHIRRKDLWASLFQNVVQFIYFFNPLVWWTNRKLFILRERACDDEAIARSQGRALEYGKMLLSSIDRSGGFQRYSSLITCFRQSRKALVQRFEYLINRKEDMMCKSKKGEKAVLAFICFLSLVLSIKGVEKTPGFQEEQVQKQMTPSPSLEQHLKYDVPPRPEKGWASIINHMDIPARLKKTKNEGYIILNMHFNKEGRPENIMVATGLEEEGLHKAVIDAVRKTTWLPALKNGRPIDTLFSLGFLVEWDEKENELSIKVIPPPPPPPSPPAPAAAPQAETPPDLPIVPKAIAPPAPHPQPTTPLLAEPSPALKVSSLKPPAPPPPPAPGAAPRPEFSPFLTAPPEPQTPPAPTKAPAPSPAPTQSPIFPQPPKPPSPPPKKDLTRGPVPVGGMAALKKNVRYPKDALKAKVSGIVVLEAVIGKSGEVLDVRIVSFPEGGKSLADAAVEAVKKTSWKPALDSGEKVKAVHTIKLTFNLK
ncbi:MAG: TonB family protein [Candidatus Aminicenantes bacterium]|nr:TonB family protein [Candidatus Aminicenantes bacterium]